MKKYTSGAFQSTTYGIYKSAQDTITSFPASIIADGENISAMTISGNMTQTSTPTPSNPVYPYECGDLVASGDHSGEYVFPVISGGVTTNVYAAEPLRKISTISDIIDSTTMSRNIKKIVLTSDLAWETDQASGGRFRFYLALSDSVQSDTTVGEKSICSHFPLSAQGGTYSSVDVYAITAAQRLYISIDNINTMTDFKSWLTDQYNNNTPVIVWYVMNEAITTSITLPSIPTTAGSQTFNIDTTLKPSSVSLTYTGWHTHSDKQYSGGSWGALTSGQILRRKRTAKRKT